ncbi:acyltransferase [Sphingobium yanoikuyae]|uniref:acyltransferase n=2 Tax=Pseudomonadota TaxID=1224 RepID=UPI001F3D1E43|nr:acyltransferase [Sphingobium yanoikuyae]
MALQFLSAQLDQLYARLTVMRLRAQGCQPGRGLRVRGGVPYLRNPGSLVIGNNVRLRNEPTRIRLATVPQGAIILGDEVSLNTGVHIFSAARIDVGGGSRIGDNVAMFDTSFHPVHEGRSVRPRPITIGRNVWIGRNAIILPGVSIGDHSVVAAGSVVFDDVPARQVWRGNPAAFVKHVRATDDFRRS